MLLLVFAQRLDEAVHFVTHGQKGVDQLRTRVAQQGTRRLQQACYVKKDSPAAEKGLQVAAERALLWIQRLELA